VFGFFVIAFSALLAHKHDKAGIYCGYLAVCTLIMLLAGAEGIEAAYQISAKPTDTHIYHKAYIAPWEQIQAYLFYQYPLILKALTYPFNNAFYAVFVQACFMAGVTVWALRGSHVLFYWLILLNHAVIYTSMNFFKDNYFLILCLLTIGVISRVKSQLMNTGTIFLSVFLLSVIRPFSLLFIPLSGIPYMFGPSPRWLKTLIWGISIAGMVAILVTQWGLIMYVFSSWSTEASVGTTGLSVTSLPKILLGPTPFHYFYYEAHFIQPILASHAVVFTLLHFVYYFALSVFLVVLIDNFKSWLKGLFSSPAALFSLGLGMAILVVYLIAYGSADVRQRAIILSLLFTAVAVPFVEQGKSFDCTVSALKLPAVFIVFILLYLMSIMAI